MKRQPTAPALKTIQKEVAAAMRTNRNWLSHVDHEGQVVFYFDGTHFIRIFNGRWQEMDRYDSEAVFMERIEACFWYKGASLLDRWQWIRGELRPGPIPG